MPPSEMQEMEMDMVQGMYDTYELLSSDPPQYSVKLSSDPDAPSELLVTITYPPLYPEEEPCGVELTNIAKHRRMQLGDIQRQVTALAEESVGTHAVVLVLQSVQEFLVTAAEEEEKAELARKGDAVAAAAVKKSGPVAVDPTVRIGTLVSKDLFEEWSKKHMAEKARERAEREKKDARSTVSKLTGRQLWDTTLKSADWELFGGDDEAGEDVEFDHLEDLDEDNFDLE